MLNEPNIVCQLDVDEQGYINETAGSIYGTVSTETYPGKLNILEFYDELWSLMDYKKIRMDRGEKFAHSDLDDATAASDDLETFFNYLKYSNGHPHSALKHNPYIVEYYRAMHDLNDLNLMDICPVYIECYLCALLDVIDQQAGNYADGVEFNSRDAMNHLPSLLSSDPYSTAYLLGILNSRLGSMFELRALANIGITQEQALDAYEARYLYGKQKKCFIPWVRLVNESVAFDKANL